MHYKTSEIDRELGEVSQFLREMGAEAVVPQPKISVTRSSIPAAMQVVVLSLPETAPQA
jgi:hypothetical protein